jgi:hypothetical protein
VCLSSFVIHLLYFDAQNCSKTLKSFCLVIQALGRPFLSRRRVDDAISNKQVSTQGGITIFLGRHSGVFNRSGKNVSVTFDDHFSFLLLPPMFSPAAPLAGGGRRTRRTRDAIPSGKGARGHDAPCPLPPGSATGNKFLFPTCVN